MFTKLINTLYKKINNINAFYDAVNDFKRIKIIYAPKKWNKNNQSYYLFSNPDVSYFFHSTNFNQLRFTARPPYPQFPEKNGQLLVTFFEFTCWKVARVRIRGTVTNYVCRADSGRLYWSELNIWFRFLYRKNSL